jgi:hypothetical protein
LSVWFPSTEVIRIHHQHQHHHQHLNINSTTSNRVFVSLQCSSLCCLLLLLLLWLLGFQSPTHTQFSISLTATSTNHDFSSYLHLCGTHPHRLGCMAPFFLVCIEIGCVAFALSGQLIVSTISESSQPASPTTSQPISQPFSQSIWGAFVVCSQFVGGPCRFPTCGEVGIRVSLSRSIEHAPPPHHATSIPFAMVILGSKVCFRHLF